MASGRPEVEIKVRAIVQMTNTPPPIRCPYCNRDVKVETVRLREEYYAVIGHGRKREYYVPGGKCSLCDVTVIGSEKLLSDSPV